MRFWLTIAALAALSACSTASLKELRQTEMVDSPHHRALAKLYLEFAENEALQYDWWSVQYFSDKGLMAAYGKFLGPEHPDDWDVKGAARQELLDGRTTLNDKLTREYREREPEKSAQLIFYYDCWLEQAEESWQTTDIETCREQFLSLLDETDTPIDVPEAQNPTVTPVITSTSYLLFFPWDEAKIDSGQAKLELEIMLNNLEQNPETEVVINGHADRSGRDDYNMRLSQKRAEFVRNMLIEAGVAPERIVYFAFGESDPQVPTADGVRELANRRVEVFLE